MAQEYVIDAELQKIMPELSNEEYKELEDSLLTEGFKGAPIIVWKQEGIIVDGHNRYNICKKHNISYEVQELEFDNRDDVIQWMIRTQLGRRNLNPLQRIEIAEKFRPLYKKRAKERQVKAGKEHGKGGTKVTENLPQPLEEKKKRNPTVDKELSDIAGVSEKTYQMGRKVLNSRNEKLIEEVKSKEKSISGAYKEMKAIEKRQNNQANDNKEIRNTMVDDSNVKVLGEEISKEGIVLSQIQKRYKEYLSLFQEDISWLLTKEFIQDEEVVTKKIHSDLQNCLEKFKDIKNLIENIQIDDLDDTSILVNRQ